MCVCVCVRSRTCVYARVVYVYNRDYHMLYSQCPCAHSHKHIGHAPYIHTHASVYHTTGTHTLTHFRAMEYLLVPDSLSLTRKLASLQRCSWASACWRLTLPWYQLSERGRERDTDTEGERGQRDEEMTHSTVIYGGMSNVILIMADSRGRHKGVCLCAWMCECVCVCVCVCMREWVCMCWLVGAEKEESQPT